MSLLWVILGTIFQFGLAPFSIMFFIFGTGAGHPKVLTLAMYITPFTCLVSALIVILGYLKGWSGFTYWWYGFPLIVTVIFFFVAGYMNESDYG
ncbi:hypothetical protein [Vibrio nigripulchritudo]|uniref:hypothetical protein n=1 Tax=Vibrio nigripulchritudo TaxID=28173 RepID=UPI0005712BF9|nr:hypothetical protein [Vibrio nigripulchritudo]